MKNDENARYIDARILEEVNGIGSVNVEEKERMKFIIYYLKGMDAKSIIKDKERGIKMDAKTEALLKRNVVADTEKQLGKKHWSEFNEAEQLVSLSNMASHTGELTRHLKEINDTYMGMSWSYLVELLKSKGFRIEYEYDFKGTGYGDSEETAAIFLNKENGLVIWAESFFNRKSVNSGKLYGEFKVDSLDEVSKISEYLGSNGCIDRDKLIFHFDYDIREGLFSKLETISEVVKFLPIWSEKNKFLWFLDFTEKDRDDADDNYKEITKSKIEKCSDDLKLSLIHI